MESTTNVDIIFVDEARDPSSMLQQLTRNPEESLVAVTLNKDPATSELSKGVEILVKSKNIRLVVTSRKDDTFILSKDALTLLLKRPLGCVGRESLRALLKRASTQRDFGILRIS